MTFRPFDALLVLSLLLLPVLSVRAEEPRGNTVEFLPAEASVKKMTYPDALDVTVFASEPEMVQPFAFAFDARGRIWVAENLNYRSRGEYSKGPISRILILEDTDGDGAMDQRTVFYEGLVFPTGLAVGHGGVWVGSPPNLLFIPDRNRDDEPDGEPQGVLNGWGVQDKHET